MGNDRVGVRGGYESLRTAQASQPLAGGIHAGPARVTRAETRAVEQVEPEQRMGVGDLLRPLRGRVRTGVEDEQHFVLVRFDAGLGCQRLEGGCDEVLLVAGRYDDAGPEARVWWREFHQGKDSPRSMSSRPRS